MKNFVDIGKYTINLNLVTHISWHADSADSSTDYWVIVFVSHGRNIYLDPTEDKDAISQLRQSLSGAIVRDGGEDRGGRNQP